MNIEDYILCYNSSPEDLQKEISTLLAKEYQPFGSPFIDKDGNIYQAMIKFEVFEYTLPEDKTL